MKNFITITEHLKHIFESGELQADVVCRKFRHTTQHGAIEGKTQTKEVTFYNLDAIISVGYRVKSLQGTQFRIWATQRLKEYRALLQSVECKKPTPSPFLKEGEEDGGIS